MSIRNTSRYMRESGATLIVFEPQYSIILCYFKHYSLHYASDSSFAWLCCAL